MPMIIDAFIVDLNAKMGGTGDGEGVGDDDDCGGGNDDMRVGDEVYGDYLEEVLRNI